MTRNFVLTMTAANLVAALVWAGVHAQSPTPPPPPVQPLVITKADIEHMLNVNKEDTSLGSIDAGRHVVDVWLDQRSANAGGERNGQVHSELTEIYVVQKGSAKMTSGGRFTEEPRYNATLPNRVSPGGAMFKTPTFGGPVQGGRTWDVNPGDIIILPPGAIHQWASIPQEMRYIIVRVDPEKKQRAGFVQELLKR